MALIGNLIPVVTFTIEIARGYRANAVELAGAAITLTALAANNVLLRRRATRAAEKLERVEVDALPEAA